MNKKLKLRSNGKDHYPNIDLLNNKPISRRFIGWEFKTVMLDGVERIALVETNAAETVNFHNDYVSAVKDGSLIAADQETAQLCGVKNFKKD